MVTLANDVFHWGDLEIRQREDVFKIGTDAILLGTWAAHEIQNAESILDVGTGTGILALILSKKFQNARIEGVDHNLEAVELASLNFLTSENTGRLSSRLGDIFTEEEDEAGKFDVIICNPPFFQSPFQVKDKLRKVARHSDQGYREWINAFRFRLKDRGQVLIVIPSSIAYNWLEAANTAGLYCAKRLDVFGRRYDPQPVRSLLYLQKELIKPEIRRICIYERVGLYSAESLKFWSSDFGF